MGLPDRASDGCDGRHLRRVARRVGSGCGRPARANDRLSASYLIALAARAVREVGELWRTAREKNKRLATLSTDTAIRFPVSDRPCRLYP